MGNFWAWFWFVAFWGAREVLGLVGEEGSEQECSQRPQGWNPVNKSQFPSTHIVGSYVKAPGGQAPVCSVTKLQVGNRTGCCLCRMWHRSLFYNTDHLTRIFIPEIKH